MAKYIAVHTLKKSPDELMQAMVEKSSEFARAMASGQTPAKCIYTWNPIPYGRTDYMFCLWEANSPKDIEETLGGFLDYLTVDNLKVDEIVWAEVAKTGI